MRFGVVSFVSFFTRWTELAHAHCFRSKRDARAWIGVQKRKYGDAFYVLNLPTHPKANRVTTPLAPSAVYAATSTNEIKRVRAAL